MAQRGPLDDDARFAILRKLYDELKEQYDLSSSDIIEVLEKGDTLIPVTAFRRELSPLETVVKYLKENKQQSLTEIAGNTQRSTKTIWQAYKGAQKKYTPLLTPADTEHFIPLSILCQRKLSILESIVMFLREQRKLTLRQIAQFLQRNDRTMWTVYSRAKKKRGDG